MTAADKKEQKKRKEREERQTKFAFQKNRKVDPMDPTGEGAPAKGQGGYMEGERMADSTATGPLFQQRPYPAPGSVLRGTKK